MIDSAELHPALLPQPPRAGDVGQRERRGDDDGAEGRLRHVLHRGAWRRPGPAVITAAPTRPVTWDREPACSATAVRDPLVLTGKPWKKPAAMLAAPMPIISWLPRTCSPRRAANDEAVDIVSASATTAMASAPRKSGGTSPQLISRDRERREALRQHADRVHAVGLQVERVDRNGGQHDDDQHARDLGQQPIQQQDADERGDADDGSGRVRLALRQPGHEGARLGNEPVGVHREPEQLGQLTDDDGQRQAVHVADLGRLGQQVGDEPELGQPGDDHHDTDEHGEQRGERDGPRRVAAGEQQRGDRRRDHRTERRVGAEHQDPGRAEDGVAEQAQDRGVEAGDRRKPGQLGVRHPLRHQQRREHQPGDDVLGQPFPLVRGDQCETRQVRAPPGGC